MEHPHFDKILGHLGKGLDEAVKASPWCHANGIRTGSRYLLYWSALLFQRPEQKVPYLFLYGEQETGKSTLHQALGLLMSKGYGEARNSLLTKFNGELDGKILAYIEEIDLSGKGMEVYNRIKDLVTADSITIHPKYVTPYEADSYLHWIQVANSRHHCPIFEGDSRIVMIHVEEKPQEDIPTRVLQQKLGGEAPDFLRTLFDIPLPEQGVGRLYLPVLDTEARQAAIAESMGEEVENRFDPTALADRIKLRLLTHWFGEYRGFVADLAAAVDDGPWSQDPSTFGQQLNFLRKNPEKYGVKISPRRTKQGSSVVIEEDFDCLDAITEWVKCADMENMPAVYTSQIPSEQELRMEADLPPVPRPLEGATSGGFPTPEPTA